MTRPANANFSVFARSIRTNASSLIDRFLFARSFLPLEVARNMITVMSTWERSALQCQQLWITCPVLCTSVMDCLSL
jgi:hypothetical protein